MRTFSLRLNQKQAKFFSFVLPKGYSLSRLKDGQKETSQQIPLQMQKHHQPKPNTQKSQQPHSQSHDSSFLSQKEKKTKPQQKRVIQKSKDNQEIKINTQERQSPKKILQKVKVLNQILDDIQKRKSSSIFIEPVDPIKLQIPHYFDIIKQPMDIMTMRRKVIQNKYLSFIQFKKDLKKIASNCLTFNIRNDFFIKTAEKFSKQSQSVLNKYKHKIQNLFESQFQNTSKNNQEIEPNSQDETQSEEQHINKKVKKIRKQKINTNYKQQENKLNDLKENLKEQKLTNTKVNENKRKELVQKNAHENINLKELNSEQNQKEEKQAENRKQKSETYKAESLPQKKDKFSTHNSLQYNKQKKGKKKKYSYDQRLEIIRRIKNLSREIMKELFKAIQFQKGSALDFKVLEDDKINEIDTQLKKFELIQEIKINQIREQNKKVRDIMKEDFQIAQDKDYQN